MLLPPATGNPVLGSIAGAPPTAIDPLQQPVPEPGAGGIYVIPAGQLFGSVVGMEPAGHRVPACGDPVLAGGLVEPPVPPVDGVGVIGV